jgi:branched-chain amino acid transport system permease protein
MTDVNVVLQVLVSGCLMGLVYALIAVGFTLIFGVLDVVNFAHGQMVMGGMFAAFALHAAFGLDPFVSLFAIVPMFFVFGLVIFRGLIGRLVESTHASHTVVTLGLFIVLENVVNLIYRGDARGITTSYTSRSLHVGTVSVPIGQLAAAVIALVAVTGLTLFLNRSSLGMAVQAAASNRIGAQLVGVNVRRAYATTFAIGTALTGIAGAVMAPVMAFDPFIGGSLMLRSFAIAIIGGLGNLPGAVAAALFIGIVEALSSLFLKSSLGNAVTFALLILVLLFRPNGLFARTSG